MRRRDEDEPFRLSSVEELRNLPHWELMQQIREGISSLRVRTHKALRRELARNYQRAFFLANETGAYKAFCADPIWHGHKKKPRPDQPEDALRFVLRAARGWDGARATSSLSKWLKPLDPLWKAKIPPLAAVDVITKKKKAPTSARGEPVLEPPKPSPPEYLVLHLLPSGVGCRLRKSKAGQTHILKLRVEGRRGAALKVQALPLLVKRK